MCTVLPSAIDKEEKCFAKMFPKNRSFGFDLGLLCLEPKFFVKIETVRDAFRVNFVQKATTSQNTTLFYVL